MTAPGVELRWGVGFENHPRKREWVRPLMRQALDLALEGVEHAGLQIGDRKYLVADQREPNAKFGATAHGKTSHVGIGPEHIRHRRRSATIWYAKTVFHEIVHLVNEEHYTDFGLIEVAAAEGIAYTADYLFANSLLRQAGLSGPPCRLVKQVEALPRQVRRRIEGEFLEASTADNSWTTDNVERWFVKSRAPLNWCQGPIAGISIVARLMEEGWDTADLVQTPPEVVLGVK